MATSPKKLAFISYRREDSSAPARSVRDHIEMAYGSSAVFMDVDRIRVGAQWQEVIRSAIARADVLVLVIGPTWLRMDDEFGRRRLDKEGDWVREEVALSLLRRIPIVPVLVSRATFPPREALPTNIQGLAESQYHELREERWREDLNELFDQLDEFGFQRTGQSYNFPHVVSRDVPRAFTEAEIGEALRELPGWELSTSPLPGQFPKERVEIMKLFQFRRFGDAVEFMHTSVPEINKLNHHPRWENLWKTLTIFSSTWDSGHVITYKDIDLAKLLDNLYAANPNRA